MGFETTAIKELLTHEGWEIVKDRLLKRKADAITSLLSLSDLQEVVRAQARIKEINYLLELPHDLLKHFGGSS